MLDFIKGFILEKGKMSKIIGFLWLLIVVFISLYVIKSPSSTCEQFRNVNSIIIDGKVVNKYILYKDRPVGNLVIESHGDTFLFDYLQGVGGYDSVNISDSVFKRQNSLDFDFYRKGRYVSNIVISNCE